nr:bifunctional biotin--[acetyl-CoA-carboxylase] ligase/biotin operon repressor BirA [Lysobacter changpingensis]
MNDRELLQRLIAGPVSGDALAREGGQTRAAVWKRIETLREAGVPIQAQAGRGYALAAPMDLLDAEAIRAALPSPVRDALALLETAWSIDSTNTELVRRPVPTRGADVLLAERQTGGRGRRGRPWASPLAAHLYLSVSRQFGGGLARLGGLSLVAGVAAAEALREAGFGVALKWPNDLVVPAQDGTLRKLGGILVEGGGEHAGPVRAVIGMGINVRMPAAIAAGIDQPWCDLAGLSDAPPDRNRLAAAVLARLLPALDEFDAEGLAPFRERYAALDVLTERRVTLHTPSGELHGIALGLADDGALRVRLAGGEERSFHSGEVSVRSGAAA